MKKIFVTIAKICTVVFGMLFLVLSTGEKIMLENVTMMNNTFKQSSQVIVEKGFAFMCHTNRRDLAKADVPTLYNNLIEKYNNVDVESSALQTISGNYGYMCCGFIDNYLYTIKEDNGGWFLFRTSKNDLSNPVWEKINNENLIYAIGGNSFFVGKNNIVIINATVVNSEWGYLVKIFDTNGNKKYENFFVTTGNNRYFSVSLVEEENKSYFYLSYEINSYQYELSRFEDTANINIEHIAYTNKVVSQISKINDIYFCLYDTGDDRSFRKTLDWNTLTYLTSSGSSYAIIGNTIRTTKSNQSAHISYDLGENWETINWSGANYYKFHKFNNIDKYLCVSQDGSYNFFVTEDLINFDFFNFGTAYSDTLSFTDDNNSFVCMGGDYILFYSGIVKKEYTDTYKINGNTVTVKYYKYQDFKICISDNGGTNDTNLETVFNYLGYLNYWLLDIINETIAIQRDKNTYAVMYVGDNFIDDTDNLATNDYAGVVLKNQRTNNIFITPETLSSLQDGNSSTVYQTTKPTVIIFGISSNKSDWYAELQVSHDNDTFIKIARYGVGNGDPSSSAILSVTLGTGVYWKLLTNANPYMLKYGELK